MRFGVLSENRPISPHLEWRNSRGEMECIKQTMRTAGSRALFSSESVPVLTMLIQGRAARSGLRNKKQQRTGEAWPWMEVACGESPNESTQSSFTHKDGVEDKKQFYILSYTPWLVHILIWRNAYKDKLTRECNEIHIVHVIRRTQRQTQHAQKQLTHTHKHTHFSEVVDSLLF